MNIVAVNDPPSIGSQLMKLLTDFHVSKRDSKKVTYQYIADLFSMFITNMHVSVDLEHVLLKESRNISDSLSTTIDTRQTHV